MKQDQLKHNIDARIHEVAGYQINIDNYSRLIEEIPAEWDDSTRQYQGKETAELVSLIADDDLLNHVADLVFKDKLIATLRTERLEQRKAKLVLKVLQDQIEA